MKIVTNLDLLKNQLLNAVLQLLGSDPSSPVEGQFYHNTANHIPKIHDGTAFRNFLLENRVGVANGVAGLDTGGKVPTSQLPDSVVGQLEYQGAYDASGGTAPGSPLKGNYWVISVGGTFNTVTYAVGDWAVYNGTIFEKIDNTDAVTQVAGRIGNIILTTADVAPSTDRNYLTDAKLTVMNNTSGTNSGNETTITIGALVNGATAKDTPVDADSLGFVDSQASNVIKKMTFANLKAFLVTYFNTLYNLYTHPTGDGNLHVPANGTGNANKYLQATGTAGVYQWATVVGGVSKYTVAIGNGALTSIPVTHNLNSLAVVVEVYDTASKATVLADVVRTDVNTVTVSFGTAPTSGQYTVVVVG